MVTAKVTSKGQITIPKELREKLGIEPGDQLEFFEDAEGIRVRKQRAALPFDKYRGYLKHLAGRSSDEIVEEMRGR